MVTDERTRELRLQWSVKTDLRPGWYADHLGIRDGQDVVDWRESAAAVAETYARWSCAAGPERALRFAAYTATLDQEHQTAAA